MMKPKIFATLCAGALVLAASVALAAGIDRGGGGAGQATQPVQQAPAPQPRSFQPAPQPQQRALPEERRAAVREQAPAKAEQAPVAEKKPTPVVRAPPEDCSAGTPCFERRLAEAQARHEQELKAEVQVRGCPSGSCLNCRDGEFCSYVTRCQCEQPRQSAPGVEGR